MREIKFRAWDNNNVQMLDCNKNCVWEIDSLGNWQLMEGDFEHGHGVKEDLMQYTGLKDKNNVGIYEGDICKWNAGEGELVFEVKWNQSMTRFNMAGFFKVDMPNVEVIGNIYKNKELLK